MIVTRFPRRIVPPIAVALTSTAMLQAALTVLTTRRVLERKQSKHDRDSLHARSMCAPRNFVDVQYAGFRDA